MSSVAVDKLPQAEKEQLSVSYAAFILSGAGAEITADSLNNVLKAAKLAASPALINAVVKAELFPTHSRTLLMSVGYSLSVAIFGGFAPYIATWLIDRTGSPIAPTYYLIASGIVSFIVIWSFRETAHQELR